MDWTKFSISTLLGGVVYFFCGWLVFGMILSGISGMPESFSAVVEYPPEEFKISLMILSCLVWGALLTFILMRWAGISTFMGGFKAGALIGALNAIAVGLSMASMYKFMAVDSVFINAVGEIVCSGLAGGAIGWYLGRGK